MISCLSLTMSILICTCSMSTRRLAVLVEPTRGLYQFKATLGTFYVCRHHCELVLRGRKRYCLLKSNRKISTIQIAHLRINYIFAAVLNLLCSLGLHQLSLGRRLWSAVPSVLCDVTDGPFDGRAKCFHSCPISPILLLYFSYQHLDSTMHAIFSHHLLNIDLSLSLNFSIGHKAGNIAIVEQGCSAQKPNWILFQD